MTLAEFARNHPLLHNIRFVEEEITNPPVIVGLVGGMVFRNEHTLNSIIYRMTPHYNDDVFERKELAKQYPNIEYKQKKAVDIFRGRGVCYLDVNYMHIINDYVQSQDEYSLVDLAEEYSYLGFDPALLNHEIQTQHQGKTCPEDCHQCATLASLDSDTKHKFVNDVIVKELLKPILIDKKNFINEQWIVVVLPVRSEFAQYCDLIIHADDCEECKQTFIGALPENLHAAYLEQLEDLPNDFISINIGDDMEAAADQITNTLRSV